MNSNLVLVVGAGHAACELALSLRAQGFAGEIILVGQEVHLPYQRPALSKGFLTGEISHEQLYVRSATSLEKANIQLISGVGVVSIDRTAKSAALSDGRTFLFSRLVFATGGRARRLMLADKRIERAPNIYYLRTIDDVNAMRESFKPGMQLVIIGGGYIGLEVAAAARQKGVGVTLLEATPRILSRVTAPVVSNFYDSVHRAAGVNILVNSEVTGFTFDEDGRVTGVECRRGPTLSADFVLVGIGLLPNTEVAQTAGLAVDNGIVVDEYGQTSDPNVLAIGDCTSHWNLHAGRRVRLESVPSTVEQARSAASLLMGKKIAYDSVPWFWSDQYKIKLQIAGLNQGYEEVVLRGSPAAESFLAFYLKDRTLIAVDAVNRARDFQACKKLVAARVKVSRALLEDECQPLAAFIPKAPLAEQALK